MVIDHDDVDPEALCQMHGRSRVDAIWRFSTDNVVPVARKPTQIQIAGLGSESEKPLTLSMRRRSSNRTLFVQPRLSKEEVTVHLEEAGIRFPISAESSRRSSLRR